MKLEDGTYMWKSLDQEIVMRGVPQTEHLVEHLVDVTRIEHLVDVTQIEEHLVAVPQIEEHLVAVSVRVEEDPANQV